MEFDRQRTRWPQLLFFFAYSGAAVYLLLSSNPYLYSHKELRLELAGEQREEITPIPQPSKQEPQSAGGEVSFWPRQNPGNSGAEASAPREKDFVPEWQKRIAEPAPEWQLTGWTADESGIYVTGTTPWLLAHSPEGDLKWRFAFAPSNPEPGLLFPTADQQNIYVAQSNGKLAALSKSNGHLRWTLQVSERINAAPLIVGDELWVVAEPFERERERLEGESASEEKGKRSKKTGPALIHRFVRLNRATGEFKGYSDAFYVKEQAELTLAMDLEQVIVVSDNKMTALGTAQGDVLYTQALPDPIVGPAAYAEGHLYLSLRGGKIQSWDPSKKGKFDWELELEASPVAPPVYVPLYHRLALLTDDGHLRVIDLKKAEQVWQVNLETPLPAPNPLTTRLSGKHFEKLGMKWEKKGWSIWAPCGQSRLCIYNPDKGQLVSRTTAEGRLISPPLLVGKGFYLLSEAGKQDDRAYRLSAFMDEESFRKKAKDATEAAAASSAHPAGHDAAKTAM